MASAGASEEPLLLIPGLGQGTWIWRDVLPTLERGRRVIAFEPAGTGKFADRPACGSVAAMAADASAELAGPVDVLGFSMGGYVGLTIALEKPELVRSLLLFATGAEGPRRVPRPRHVADAFTDALGLPYEEFARRTMPFTFAPGWAEANPERFEQIVAARMERPTTYETIEAHANACYAFHATGCEAERISVPALVVHGDQDLIVPVENGRMLAARLPNVQYIELAGLGHNLMLEDPDLFARIVVEFLA
jgi:3-oxoadipate enol-lactonase